MVEKFKKTAHKSRVNWQELDTEIKKLMEDRSIMSNEEQFFKQAWQEENSQQNQSWEEQIYDMGSNKSMLLQSYEGMTKWANQNQRWMNHEISLKAK